MFDFIEEQMLVYILLKMLKKEHCETKFGDNFSTFHLKTAMLFTIERHPPDIWCIDNIVVCATYCIDTLIQWAHDKVCPHFTMGGVNLFHGKLSESEINDLESFLTHLNNHIEEYRYICNLKMDCFGEMVLQKVHDQKNKIKRQKEILNTIEAIVASEQQNTIMSIHSQISTVDVNTAVSSVTKHATYVRSLQIHGSELQREAADLLFPLVSGILASIQSSRCIDSRQPVTRGIINLYEGSFECNLMNGKLKYASMLYNSGQ